MKRAWILLATIGVALISTGCNKQEETPPVTTTPPPTTTNPPGPSTSNPPGPSTNSPTTTPPASSPNELLKRKVVNALMTNKALMGQKINVEAKDGDVTLSGTVATAEEKTLAEKAAKAVSGVKSVTNSVTVK